MRRERARAEEDEDLSAHLRDVLAPGVVLGRLRQGERERRGPSRGALAMRAADDTARMPAGRRSSSTATRGTTTRSRSCSRSRARSSSCSASPRPTGTRRSRRRRRTRSACSSSPAAADVPVAAGADRAARRASSSSRRTSTARAGSTARPAPAERTSRVADDAVAFIARRVARPRAPVTLVATGPLTNVARYLDAHGPDGHRAHRAHGRRDRRGQHDARRRVQHLGRSRRRRSPCSRAGST